MYGHGAFIFEPAAASKKYRNWDGVASALLKMKMNHAWIRGHGKDGLFEVKDNLSLVGALRKADIKVLVWGWCQGEGQLDKDIKNAADAIAKFDPDGYVADIEQGVNGAEWTAKGIKTFLTATRAALGGKPLILSTHGFVPYHEPELMRAADPFVDAFAPQVYWFWYPNKRMLSQPGAKGPYKTNDAAAYASLCLDVWRHITRKPIVITAQAYWGENQQWGRQDAENKLQEFVTRFTRYDEIAGLNWWHLAGNAAMSPAMEELIAAADFQAKLGAVLSAGEEPSVVPATLLALNGEAQPLDLIAPQFDTASALAAVTPRIIATAKASAIARYDWKNRGPACVGYTAGMAVAYAAAYARLQAHDPVADRMSRALEPAFRDHRGHLKGDALTWYDDQFKTIGMGAATSLERLRRLFVLQLGLGVRESSGRYCEGRDRSAQNTSADTAEAGLFQISFDLLAARAELLDIFHHYQSNPEEGLRETFEEEMSPPPRAKDLENFGPSTSPGFAFQKLSKECPAMTVEIAALGLREEAGHWGPIINHAAEVRSASKELLLTVEGIIDAPMTAATESVIKALGATVMEDGRSRPEIARFYSQRVDLADLLPINKHLSSAKEETMISLLGAPHLPLTTHGQNERASDLVKRNLVIERMSPLFRLQGLEPAIADLKTVLAQAFAAEPDLESVLSTEGMLSVRMRKPTDGSVSTKISNHAWGTAVDFKIVGFEAPANTGRTVPRFIAILIPLLNAAGWYSGVGFRDTMHFEVSEERIRKWSNEHVFR
ncbi:M15 family metallopeptidase [Bradyrhizobium sp. UFLA05-153]